MKTVYAADMRMIDLYAMLARVMMGRMACAEGAEKEAWEIANRMMMEREKYVGEE